ncbi:lytic transglycosylase domain-containing protein [Halomonas sp. McH1-25]|uniref:lytic transglycosylase domain-containing protein n=1 Tax=unclassified Halomonas TaxID=2609666 RepID=UPI001EF5F731|nr:MULTISPECIES: lytic transglycosylase domain-containing protein [unclassified Halomonas]MCG7598200.1 lytic transglycosylase domain-containing protein [Halomonas sp. McH1-25]MCP1341017.1 lytic transglycosylase domain-containing protein [Halomonas sp. FL8]MCP1360920.1 lytic transglycosylase domain-containing protein [Halomonas sp. BBD45]
MATFLHVSSSTPATAAAQVPEALPPTLIDTLTEATTFPFDSQRRATTETWLAHRHDRLARFAPQAERRLALLAGVQAEATLAGLSPDIVMAVIQVESGFDSHAVSSAGAQGLMQIMPFWKEAIGRADDNLLDPGLNLRYGCTILAYYLKLESGDLTRALARYNGSLGQTWYPERVMQAWVEYWWTSDAD